MPSLPEAPEERGFDTPRFDVYCRNGSYGRAKYRIRRYDDGKKVFLERKLKSHGVVGKRRLTVKVKELGRLENGEPDRGWYLGDDPARYRSVYEIKSKDDPKAWSDLINLCTNCWPCRLCGSAISATCAISPKSGSTLIAAGVEADTRKLDTTANFTAAVTEDAAEPAGGPGGFGGFPGGGGRGGGRGGPGGMSQRPSLSLKSFFEQRRAFLLNYPEIKSLARAQ